MTETKLILVPVDFSEPSDAALDWAIRLAQGTGDRLHLLHVVHLPAPVASIPAAEIGASFETLNRYAGDWADTELRALMRRKGLPEDTDFTVVSGEPVHSIVDTARDLGAGLVVMGTHGRTGFSRLLMGSVAERVVRSACCPVLTVRDHYEDRR